MLPNDFALTCRAGHVEALGAHHHTRRGARDRIATGDGEALIARRGAWTSDWPAAWRSGTRPGAMARDNGKRRLRRGRGADVSHTAPRWVGLSSRELEALRPAIALRRS